MTCAFVQYTIYGVRHVRNPLPVVFRRRLTKKGKPKPPLVKVGSNHFFFDLPAAWVSAVAATLLTAFDDLGSRSSLDAMVATRADVCSLVGFLLAMVAPLPNGH